MPDWTRICCAFDFSRPAQAALDLAAHLAARHRAELTVVHVNEAALYVTAGDAGLTTAELLEMTAQEAQRRLDGVMVDVELASGGPVRRSVVSGRAADEIVRFVHASAFDLLVLGSHGRTGMSRLVRGSVAEEVERRVACPVLMVKAPGPSTP